MARNLERELDELKREMLEIKRLLPKSPAAWASEAKSAVGAVQIPAVEPEDADGIGKLRQLVENRAVQTLLQCIGNPDRLQILLTLLQRPRSVAELVEACGCNTTGQVYHHLKPLIAAGLAAQDKHTGKGSYCVPAQRRQGILTLLGGVQALMGAEIPAERAEIHSGAVMVDERYIISPAQEKKVLDTFFVSVNPPVLKALPPKEKKKLAILTVIAAQFEKDRRYREKEVNQILEVVYEDYVTIRRCLIEYGFLSRTADCAEYWVTPEE